MKNKNSKRVALPLLCTVHCALCAIIALCALFNGFEAIETKAASSSEIVMEVSSLRVLHENNAYEKKEIASLTKVLTAITVIESCDIEKSVTIKKECTGIEGSSVYLMPGETLTVRELLYGLMLRSGNDCAESLAVYKSGSVEKFGALMNEKAKSIGAKDSNFVNPHGLSAEGHYSTAYDLALITCYAMKNSVFKEIVGTKRIEISNEKGEGKRILYNKNKMLSEYQGATGVKTGFTRRAGRCLISSSLRNGMEVVCVVLNVGDMFGRSKELMDRAHNNFKTQKLFDSSKALAEIPIEDTNKTCPVYAKKDFYYPVTDSEADNIKTRIEVPEYITPPLKKDSEIGNIKIYLFNRLIFSEKIYTIIDVNQKSFFELVKDIVYLW